MANDFWEYAEQRRRECRELSVSDEELTFAEEEGSHSSRGQVHGHVDISGEVEAYLDVREVVVVEGGYAHREEYGYFLVVNGVELWGRERDPSHEPADHGHAREHTRVRAEPISFKAAVELAWEHVSHMLEFGLADFDPLAPEN